MRVRLSAVGYLNSRPLVRGLEEDAARFDVSFDVPARCADRLHAGEVDVGLIPSIEYLRGEYVVVPRVAIASHGPVASVALFTRCPLDRVRRVALDTSSRTSAALLRILCAERWGISPSFAPHEPDLGQMLEEADAALLIGDPALFCEPAAGVRKVDLGAEWTAMTGLPFVWAFWAVRPEAAGGELVQALVAARDAGVAAIDEIARGFGAGDPARRARAAAYLRQNVQYDLGGAHRLGLERYYAAAARLGLVPAAQPVRFCDAGVRATV
jgi:chorismate dehydratase